MTRLVLKFGGTSVGDPDRIARVARIIAAARAQHARATGAEPGVAVVVSAMAGETDRLVGLTEAVRPGAVVSDGDEYDAVVAAGEQASAGLVALALRGLGLRARSWLGWQVGVRTDSRHGHARINAVDADALGQAVDGGEIAIAAGFQGVTSQGRISTLGRGGSDTSAVALAAALSAARCDIYTDVDGVYTTDPRIEERARRLQQLSFEEMLEMASLGAKVLQTRAVELAMGQGVPLRVLSSFVEPEAMREDAGTLVSFEDPSMEQRIVSGVAYTRNEAQVTVMSLPDKPGFAAALFERIGRAELNVDMIVQNPARSETAANLAFTVAQSDLDRAVAVLEDAKDELRYSHLLTRRDLAKVSVVGVGMRSHSGVAHLMFSALAERGISIEAISTSEIKISVLVAAEYVELAVRSLHAAYGLDQVEG